MKPNRDLAELLMRTVEHSKDDEWIFGTEEALKMLRTSMLTIASNLIPHGENYGHAQRIHDLTKGNDNGNDD